MANKKAASISKVVDDYHPFGMSWLDSAYQETLLPNGPWQNTIYRLLCDRLAQSISRQLDIPERRQIIFELVGEEFVKNYFPGSSFSPQILDALTPEARKKLEGNARNWLTKNIQKAARETGLLVEPSEQLSDEMLDFIDHTKQIMQQGLNRHLYCKERELINKWERLQWKEVRTDVAQHRTREYENMRRQRNRLKSFLGHEETQRRSSQNGETESLSPARSGSKPLNVKGALFGSHEDPPLFWGIQSNSIGRSVLSVLKRDPRRLSQTMRFLHGRQLPGSLRAYVWLDVLMKSDRDRLNDSNTERILREQFAKGIKRGVSELRIKEATNSPINGLISNTVGEIAFSTPAMAVHKKDDVHMREATKALNILYVYNRVYEPYLVHWLFPLQLALQDGTGQADHPYELAMFLDLLNRNFLPNAPKIFAMAEKAMAKVEAADPEFYFHLKKVAQINPTINPKEFLVRLIHTEKSESGKFLEGSSQPNEMSRHLLTDPLIFLRKWLGEGFVGVLDTQAVIFVWDQLFLQRWAAAVAEDFCLALLFLLRHKFMEAQDYSSMKQVFFEEPCKLLTMDLQKAWIHVQEGSHFNDISAMNRMHFGSDPFSTNMAVSPSETVAMKPLDAAGIKIKGMELIFSDASLKSVPELSNLDPHSLHIVCTVHGIVRPEPKLSTPAAVLRMEEREDGGRKYVFVFDNEELIFRDLDLSSNDLEPELGGSPKAVFEIKYVVGDSELRLGWTEVELYHSLTEPSDDDFIRWSLITGEKSREILPLGATGFGDTGLKNQGLISSGSVLDVLVFQPFSEEPRQTGLARSSPSQFLGDNDTFVLYIDAVTNIPDSASIIKVTGRFINTGEVDDIPDILALPDINSPARSPIFSYRLIVNEAKKQMSDTTTLLLRIYTVTLDTKELVIVGNCVFDIFNSEKKKVRLGYFAKALRYGLPHIPATISGNSLDSHARIPASWIYFRLLRYDKASQYEYPQSDYESIDSPNTESEMQVLGSYGQDSEFPRSVRDAAALLHLQDSSGRLSESLDIDWMAKKLDRNLNLPPNTTVRDLELSRVVKYRQQIGVHVQLSRAYWLPERYVVHCAAYLSPQKTSPNDSDIPLPFCVYTRDFDVDSHQKSPRWLDPHTTLHPELHRNTCLIVLLYGLDVKYLPQENHSSIGTLVRANGRPFTKLDETCIGWTFLPIFQGLFVNSAEHHLPVFKGKPSQYILRELLVRHPESILKDLRQQQTAAVLVVNMWDGHFQLNQWPGKLRPKKVVDGMDEPNTDGQKISQFVLDALDRTHLNNELFKVTYEKERELFKMAVMETFHNLLF